MKLPFSVDEYRIVRLIGRGGMGDVYLAHDQLLDRPVAIKFIRVSPEKASAREQFLFEARVSAQLQHPNVCVTHRIAEWRGQLYIVSELIKGNSLAAVALPLPERDIVDIAIGVARGLAAAHRRGILHRDIKPANVLRSDAGEVKLVDFGIAELAPEADSLSLLEENAQTDLLIASQASGDRRRSSRPLSRKSADGEMGRLNGGATPAIRTSSSRPLAGRPGSSSQVGRLGTLSMLGLGSRRVVGTADYVAPELWRGRPASKQSDVYSLGALLYELCVGEPPYGSSVIDELPHITQVEERSLSLADPSVHSRLSGIVDKCLRRDPAERFCSGEELCNALEELLPSPRKRQVPEGNPYRGLSAFEAEHSSLFFGRDREILSICERLRSDPMVVVIGDSGVGKSSLCKAGLIPQWLSVSLSEDRKWIAAALVPGEKPMDALSYALSAIDDFHRASPKECTGSLAQQTGRLLGKAKGILLFVDQLEELVTISERAQAKAFCECLDELLLSGLPIRLLATARSDFFPQLANLPDIGGRLGRSLYVLRTLEGDGVRDAVVGPITAKGFRFESPELIHSLVESTKGTDSGLPLLQFALAELWELRDTELKIIPASALASVGGVTGALAKHADAVLAQMLPGAQAHARRILLSLVTYEGTRARRTAYELGVETLEARITIERLVHARLVVVREGETGALYEIAHEALISGWQTLRNWLDESMHIRAARDRVTSARLEWERLDRATEALWGSKLLGELNGIAIGDLSPKEVAFLTTSRRVISYRKFRTRAMMFGIPLVSIFLVLLTVLLERRDLSRAVDIKLTEATKALGDALEFERKVARDREKAVGPFEILDGQHANREWRNVLEKIKVMDQRFQDVTQKVEAALLMESRNAAARGLLANVLYERALIAERYGFSERMDELLKRLRILDDQGSWWARWTKPGLVSIASDPPGAEVVLERYSPDVKGRLISTEVATLGMTPVAGVIQLDQGSYRLTFSLAGYSTVHFPFVAKRNEMLPIRVQLPSSREVPDGFVYVPAGVSNVGVNDWADLNITLGKRGGEKSTYVKGFLIKKYETTFGEWISFRESLPASARNRPRVRSGSSAFYGDIDITRVSKGKWELVWRDESRTILGGASGIVSYRYRDRRKLQSWHRFPVVGVSFSDAIAYTRYLRQQSPHLKTARLCRADEWIRAARGADSRVYPHGNVLEADDANWDATYGSDPRAKGPDEVGSHPTSRSPFDVDDLAGNVWEWGTSIGRKQPTAVLGGSYRDDKNLSEASSLYHPEVTFRSPHVGFRICADAPWEQAATGVAH